MKLISPLATKLMSRRIALGFMVAMVLIASGFAISFYSYTRYSNDMERVQHTYDVIGSLENTLSLVKDVETGSRGYVITNDSSYLEPYTAAITLLPDRIRQLELLVGDNKSQVRRMVTLRQLIDSRLAMAELRAKNRLTLTPADLKLSGEGKRLMTALRHHVAMMVETERVLMKMRNRQADRSFDSAIVIILVLSALTLVVLIISYRMLEQELTRRQQTENQLRAFEIRLKEQIRQLEASNEELERFAFVASHDLQEPLRKIQAFSNLIMDRYSNLFDGDSAMFMNKINHSAERMSKLIKDLLNFSRISNHREDFIAVRLADIIQRILDDQELRIKGLGVQVVMGKMPMIQAVTSQMDHLFTNLISNALKFTRPGVVPSLRIEATMIDGRDHPELVAGRSYAEITIEDNGIGFDEKYLDHIFKVFQRLHSKSEFEGTGIGLAICKRVVMYHHGHITAHSQPGQGTTFIVVLPEQQSRQDYDQSTFPQTYSHSTG